MTTDEAKTYLSLCPPEDETNPDVPRLAAARELALANPELAAWWEQEKSFDTLFSQKLTALKPPPELQPTIMRGGATIFFASRLIAESANEDEEAAALTEDNMPSLLPSPAAAALADGDDRPAERDKLDEMESALTKRWIWRMGLVMVGVVGMLVIVFLFFFEYNIASKNVASQTRQALAGKLAELESLAVTLDAVAAPATSRGQTAAELRKFLEDSHLPNPPAWPALVAQPKSGDVVTVAAESWENVPVAHFTVQNGVNLSHLGIFKTPNLHLKDGTVESFSGTHGAYHEEIWGDKDFTYIQLTPAQPKP